jgi:hypothetical protein
MSLVVKSAFHPEIPRKKGESSMKAGLVPAPPFFAQVYDDGVRLFPWKQKYYIGDTVTLHTVSTTNSKNPSTYIFYRMAPAENMLIYLKL